MFRTENRLIMTIDQYSLIKVQEWTRTLVLSSRFAKQWRRRQKIVWEKIFLIIQDVSIEDALARE